MNKSYPEQDFVRRLLALNAKAISDLERSLGDSFGLVVDEIARCEGNLIVTGVGKAGLIGSKISATFTATGTTSFFLHPVEALHGDLGQVRRNDIVLVLSYSGASEEIIRLVDPIKERGAKIVALTGNAESPIARRADRVLSIGEVEEASPLGLVPSVSTTCLMVLGDALALSVMKRRGVSPAELAALHPGGLLGRKTLKVEEVMGFRIGENLPVASENLRVREVLSRVSGIKRRCGAILLVDLQERLSGIFTDSDLRRLLEKGNESLLDRSMEELMVRRPKFIRAGSLVAEAMDLFHKFRIDELPVLDANDKPIGLIDVQDIVGF